MVSTVIGIDLGTQALKVLFLDAHGGGLVASASAPLALHRGDNGVAEQEHQCWLSALSQAMSEIDPGIRSTAQAMAVSGQQHGFVAVDRSDRVLAPVKLWCDTSTQAQAEQIEEAFGGANACIRELGNRVLPGYTASKIRWLKQARPAAYDRLDAILLPHDFINLWLTGERCMEAGDASGTGFFDIRQRAWSSKMLRAIDPDRDLAECLPMPRTRNEPIGRLRPNAAQTLGLPVGIPVGIGGGDNMMGAIGTGNVCPGRMTMSLGTSGTVYAFSDQPVIDPSGDIAAFCASTDGWLPLLCTMNCTVTTELMRNLLGANLDHFEARIGSALPGSGGVITVPFFEGERTPNLPNARGGVLGLNSRNMQPDNLLRSAVEGATFALKYGIDELSNLGVSAEEIVLTGGGQRSAAWRQMVADVCNTPVTIYHEDEGAALGAAIQALQLIEPGEHIAVLADATLSRNDRASCVPVNEAVETYNEAYQRYRKAAATVSTLYQ